MCGSYQHPGSHTLYCYYLPTCILTHALSSYLIGVGNTCDHDAAVGTDCYRPPYGSLLFTGWFIPWFGRTTAYGVDDYILFVVTQHGHHDVCTATATHTR